MTPLIGIMQGRLSPPVNGQIQAFPVKTWREEFALARRAGLDCIEWVYDAENAGRNPLDNDAELEEIRALSAEHRVGVRSICADYFVDRPFVGRPEREIETGLNVIGWLIARAKTVGARIVVIPFVDNSALRGKWEIEDAGLCLRTIAPVADWFGIEIHLELALPPEGVKKLLSLVPDKNVKITYDSGNSASLGYDCAEEWDAYGKRIGSVHIKDRLRGRGTVPLGTGNAMLHTLFNKMHQYRYGGHVILQVARGIDGGELDWAISNLEYVQAFYKHHAHREPV